MMQLYGFWRSLATYRVRVALNLKGLTADESAIDLDAGDQISDRYLAVNPQAVLPSLIEDGAEPLTQSLAILEYLEETHPNPPLLPKAPRDRARARAFALIVACDAHPFIVPRVQKFLAGQFGLDDAQRMTWSQHWLRRGLDALEARLVQGSAGFAFCQGDAVTIADICLASHVVGCTRFGVDLAPYPQVRRVNDACQALDAFARAHPLRQLGAPAHI